MRKFKEEHHRAETDEDREGQTAQGLGAHHEEKEDWNN